MGKVLFGGGVSDIRRSIAGQTFSRNKGGSYIRNRVRPTNPQTVNQIRLRESLSALSKRWGAFLTQGQRDAWTDFATINTFIDVLGQTLTLSGIQIYIKLNTRISQVGETIIDDPPLNLDVTQLTALTATFSLTGPVYDITFTPAISGSEGIQIFSTPPLSQGITFVKNRIRQLLLFSAAQTSPLELGAEYVAKFGVNPPEGAKIVTEIRVLNPLNGAISVPLRADLTVTS